MSAPSSSSGKPAATALSPAVPDNNLAEELLASPTTSTDGGNIKAQSGADAQRAMSATQAWKPALDRRQSWDNQEYKRELQMSRIGETPTGPGFTERK